MKVIIIYESLHGSTERCAGLLQNQILSELEIRRLQDNEDINLDEFDTVIIGGSIHMGVIQTRIENFIKKNYSLLMDKKLGLYLCCMEEGENAQQQFNKAYPSDLRKKSVAAGLFGGEFNLRKMNYFEKKLTRKLTGIKTSVSKLNVEEIRKFAEKINNIST